MSKQFKFCKELQIEKEIFLAIIKSFYNISILVCYLGPLFRCIQYGPSLISVSEVVRS